MVMTQPPLSGGCRLLHSGVSMLFDAAVALLSASQTRPAPARTRDANVLDIDKLPGVSPSRVQTCVRLHTNFLRVAACSWLSRFRGLCAGLEGHPHACMCEPTAGTQHRPRFA